MKVELARSGDAFCIRRKRAAELRNGSKHKSKGIQLVKERLEILSSGTSRKIELNIADLEEAQGSHPGTCVTIKIPSL